MNKISGITLVFLVLAGSTLAQQVDYKKIILPEGASNVSFEERLVQLAWKNNPSTSAAQNEVALSQSELKSVSTRWTSLIGVNGNLNEFTINQFGSSSNSSDPNSKNLFYPRYNVSVTLPLSTFFQLPHDVKAAKAQVAIKQDNVNLLKLHIRATVLKLYAEYKKNEVIWNIRKQALADEESNYLLIEQKFKNGEASVEDYIQAQKSRNDQKILAVLAEAEFTSSKLDLEEMIGVRIEEVR